MPSKKLDKKQQEVFGKQLLEIKGNIVHDIKNMAAHNSPDSNGGGESSGHGMHIADAATDMYDREFALNLASNDREMLLEVEEALQRINAGVYGVCLCCEKPIPQKRLKAIPYVKHCLKCQEELEENA